MTPETEKLLQQLEEKYKTMGQDLDTHLEGLLYGKPITYWDYIQTDALLNLQIQQTRWSLSCTIKSMNCYSR